MFIRKIKRFIRILNSVQIVESIEELRARGVKIGEIPVCTLQILTIIMDI